MCFFISRLLTKYGSLSFCGARLLVFMFFRPLMLVIARKTFSGEKPPEANATNTQRAFQIFVGRGVHFLTCFTFFKIYWWSLGDFGVTWGSSAGNQRLCLKNVKWFLEHFLSSLVDPGSVRESWTILLRFWVETFKLHFRKNANIWCNLLEYLFVGVTWITTEGSPPLFNIPTPTPAPSPGSYIWKGGRVIKYLSNRVIE